MADWFDIGSSALGAVGSIGGGLVASGKSSDGFSKKGNGQWLTFETSTAPQQGDNKGRQLLYMAKAAGLHPLALTGQNFSSSPAIAGQPGDTSALGQGISDAFQGVGQDIRNAKMRNETQLLRDLEMLKIAADIKGQNIQNEMLSEQLRQIKNPPAPTQGESIKKIPKQVISKSAPGTEVGNEARDRWVEDSKGRFHRIPAESVADAQESSLSTQAKFTAMDIVDYLGGLGYYINPGMKIKMDSLGPRGKGNAPKPGYKWVYVPFAGAYVQVPNIKRALKYPSRKKWSRSNASKRKIYNKITNW